MPDYSYNGQYLIADGAGGVKWVTPSVDKSVLVPTEAQLEKHPGLKQAWDEYMVIRKLLGL